MSTEPLVILQESALKRFLDEALARMMDEVRATIKEELRREAAETPKEALMTQKELLSFIAVSKSDWYRKLKRCPELQALQRGRRWPGAKVKEVIDALR